MVLHAAARVAANALLILGCLRLGQNRPRPLSGGEAALAADSYDVYLLHEPLVVFLGYAAVQAALPAVAALPLVVASAVGVCLIVSAKLVRPRPGLSLVVLGLFFAALCLLFP
jgi:peptidoglycan/LPS O-acetylase OafA/YrhL